jgi:hypothetical protein
VFVEIFVVTSIVYDMGFFVSFWKKKENTKIMAAFAPRVNQVDGLALEDEFLGIISRQVQAGIEQLPRQLAARCRRFDLEISAALRLALHAMSVQASGSAYGDRLQNVGYRASRCTFTEITCLD